MRLSRNLFSLLKYNNLFSFIVNPKFKIIIKILKFDLPSHINLNLLLFIRLKNTKNIIYYVRIFVT
ncbi:hypothetical protein Hanom_Chr14g01299881 [Helianthus anomalus]